MLSQFVMSVQSHLYDRELSQGRIKCILWWKILLAGVTKSVSSTCALCCSNVGESLIPYCAGKWCISGRMMGRWLKGGNQYCSIYPCRGNLPLNPQRPWSTEQKQCRKQTHLHNTMLNTHVMILPVLLQWQIKHCVTYVLLNIYRFSFGFVCPLMCLTPTIYLDETTVCQWQHCCGNCQGDFCTSCPICQWHWLSQCWLLVFSTV